jgi:hypothetical protein
VVLRRLCRWFLARFRLNLRVVCEESAGLDPHQDYHDYPDDVHGEPAHFVPLTCKRCGKRFYI